MSDGYWKHDAYQHAVEVSPEVRGDEGAADVEPRSSAANGPYWRGDYQAQGPRLQAERSGSVSVRARQAYAAEALRQKDHVAAGLLAIFLGMFGVHKFYLGCNQTGFLMLAVSIIGGVFTFGLAAAVIEVISIIEGAIYLTKSQTEFDRVYVLNQRDWF